jgi:hypothetical protein
MIWHGLPGHPGYIAEKLGIALVDAEAVWKFMSQQKNNCVYPLRAKRLPVKG